MIKRIVCLIGIVTACLANAMSQEDIAEKVDRTDMVLRQTHYKAVNVTGAQAPREKVVMTLYHNPALAGVAGKSRYRAEAYYDDNRILVMLFGNWDAFLYQKGSDIAYDMSDEQAKMFPILFRIQRFYNVLRFYRKNAIVNYEIEDVLRGELPCYKIKVTFKPTEETLKEWSELPPEEQTRRMNNWLGCVELIVDKKTTFPYVLSDFDNSGKRNMFIDFGEVELAIHDEKLFELPEGMKIENVPLKEALRKIVAAHYKQTQAETTSTIEMKSILIYSILSIAGVLIIIVAVRLWGKYRIKAK